MNPYRPSVSDSPPTYRSYRREVERLLMWCVFQRQRALSDLTHEDMVLYQAFLADPQPAKTWVYESRKRPARSSPQWRPFAGKLSPSSQRQAMTTISGLFIWLTLAGYLAGNPLLLSKRKPYAQNDQRVRGRYLPDAHWEAVKATILAMPAGTEREAQQAARVRWLFSLLYLCGLRISEICGATMGDFEEVTGGDGRTRWWLHINGKGGKLRRVPVSGELLDELARYRTATGKPPKPRHGEATPVVGTLLESAKAVSRSTVHEMVKGVMRATASALRDRGPDFHAAADHIERASTHWLRHTSASHQVRDTELTMVRDNLGHANISTTNIYLHTGDEARHDATIATPRMGW